MVFTLFRPKQNKVFDIQLNIMFNSPINKNTQPKRHGANANDAERGLGDVRRR